jgi:TetR/AcrR family transcriptional repressor of bet genes
MHSNLISGLPPAADDQAQATAYDITSLIDGLWLRLGLEQGGIDRDLARNQLYRYLEMTLVAHQEKR